MKRQITNCLTWYANMVACTVQYKTWSDEYCRKEIREATDKMNEELRAYVDWDNLTVEEALELRFAKWSDDEPDLYLIPLYLLPVLPIGTELTSISGKTFIYDGTNVDNDIRFGCIAYGIRVKDRINNVR